LFLFTKLNLQRFGFLKKFNFPERLGLPDVTVIDSSYSNELFRTRNWRKSLFIAVLISLCSGSLFAQKGYLRSQKIELQKGWNAVYLEVDPTSNEPGTLLEGTPIDIIATLHLRHSTAQYLSNPDANLLQKQGWTVWYEDSREDSFLSDLSLVSGGRAYLVKSKENFVWNIEGEVSIWSKFKWKTNAFNLVGFPVKKNEGPTFDQFFKSSLAHKDSLIYRLKEGKWHKVEEKAAENLKSGEAFWIYCKGASNYSGPVNVDVGSFSGLTVGGNTGEIKIKNLSDFPIELTLKHFLETGKPQPIDFTLRVLDEPDNPIQTLNLNLPDKSWTIGLPSLESGQGITVPLKSRSADMLDDSYHSLLCVESGIGTLNWIRLTNVKDNF